MAQSLNVFVILSLIAFVMVLLSAMGKAPLWIAVFLLALIELLRSFGQN
jgi:heme/copper-type cytochrome/quinol oxidase subunit 4